NFIGSPTGERQSARETVPRLPDSNSSGGESGRDLLGQAVVSKLAELPGRLRRVWAVTGPRRLCPLHSPGCPRPSANGRIRGRCSILPFFQLPPRQRPV